MLIQLGHRIFSVLRACHSASQLSMLTPAKLPHLLSILAATIPRQSGGQSRALSLLIGTAGAIDGS
jgi:hypothetical protein